MDVFDLSAKITLDSTAFQNGLDKAQGAMSSFGGMMGSAFGTIAKVGTAALGAATAGVTAFATKAVSVGKTFDQAMGQVQATSGKTAEQMAADIGAVDTQYGHFEGTMRDFAQFMGSNTKFTATEAANALNYMALAGYNTQESMEMLPSVLNMAAAGAMDLATASDMITDTQSALGLSFERTSLMVQEFAKAASTGNTNVQQLGEAFLRVGGLAAETNGGFITLASGAQVAVDNVQEMEIAFTAMANAGVKGAEAGTHMRNMIMKLSAPTDKGAEALENLGVAIYDDAGQMRSLVDIFGDLRVGLDSVTQQEKLEAISEIFNARDLASAEALLAAVDQDWNAIGESIVNAWYDEESFSKYLQEIGGTDLNTVRSNFEGLGVTMGEFQAALLESGGDSEAFTKGLLSAADEGTKMANVMQALGLNTEQVAEAFGQMKGAADQMSETQLDNLAGDMQIFNSALEGAYIAVSDKLTPTLREFVQLGTQGVSDISAAFKEGGLSAAFEAFGVWLTDAAAKVVEALPTMIDAGMQLLSALAQGFFDNQDIILQAISDVVSLILNKFATGSQEEGGPSIMIFLEGLANIFMQNLPQLISIGIQITGSIMKGMIEALPEIIQGAVALLDYLGASLKENLPTIMASINEIIIFIANTLIENASVLMQSAFDLLKTLAEGIGEALPTLIPAIIDIILAVYEALLDNIDPILDAAEVIIEKLAGGLIKALPKLIAKIPVIFVKFNMAMMKMSAKMIEIGFELIVGLIAGIVQSVPALIEGAKEAFNTFIDAVKDFFGIHSPSTVFKEFGVFLIEGLIGGITDMIGDAVAAITELGQSIVDGISTVLAPAWDGMKEKAGEAWDGIKESAGTAWTGIQEGAGVLVDGIGTVLGMVDENAETKWHEMVNKGVEAWNNINEGWSHAPEAFKILFTEARDNIQNAFSTVKENMSKVWTNIKTVFSTVGSWFKDKFEEAVSNIKKAFETIGAFFEGIWTSIKDAFKISDALQWGKDLISNFVAGIKSGWGELKQGLGQLGENISDFIGFSEPKKGPLSNFHTYAPDMMKLFAEGVEANTSLVTDAVSDAFNFKDSINAPEMEYKARGSYGADANSNAVMRKVVDLLQEIVDRGLDVELTGDAEDIFRVVERKNKLYTATGGYNRLAMTEV